MKKIIVDYTELAQIVYNHRHLIGSTDWSVYVNDEGAVDIRHNTHPSGGWHKITDLYSWWDDDDHWDDFDALSYGLWLTEALDLQNATSDANMYAEDEDKIYFAWD